MVPLKVPQNKPKFGWHEKHGQYGQHRGTMGSTSTSWLQCPGFLNLGYCMCGVSGVLLISMWGFIQVLWCFLIS